METLIASQKVYIPIFSNATRSKVFELGGENPGVGGTEFVSIQLALAIAKENSGITVVLVNPDEITLVNPTPNLIQKSFENVSEFIRFTSCKQSELAIVTTSLLKKVDIDILKRFECSLVCWSHHPFDEALRKSLKDVVFAGVVCVGTYQYYSNSFVKENLHCIQNIFVFPQVKSSSHVHTTSPLKIDTEVLNIVSLGALIPGKGFAEVAKAWNQLKEKFSNIHLHVIGSSATYGDLPEFEMIPTSIEYAQEILKHIPKKDIQEGRVKFYGNLGAEKFELMKQCDFAILNPTGFTEAFPASPLECMSCGLPVIASSDYGMSDCMRFFPELAVRGYTDIPAKVEWLMEDPLRYKETKQRSIAVARWFASQNEQVITRWLRLIESVFSVGSSPTSLAPVAPFYGSKSLLFFRRDIRPTLASLNRYRRNILRAVFARA